MKSEGRYVAASALTGVVEIFLYFTFDTAIFGGLGVGMVTFSIIYSIIYHEQTGDSIWTNKQEKN
jgi:hypothetical protein